MSEISTHGQIKATELYTLFMAVMHQQQVVETIRATQHSIDNATAADIIQLADRLMQENHPLPQLKTAMNKFLNVLGNTLRRLPDAVSGPNELISLLQQNNRVMISHLEDFKQTVKRLNQQPQLNDDWALAQQQFETIVAFEPYYTIKENVLFPAIEAAWPQFRCIQMMWSYHDDIRRLMKDIKALLHNPLPDLKTFNQLIGSLYFNMYAIRLREEKLLFPQMAASLPAETLQQMLQDCHDPELPYVKAPATPDLQPMQRNFDHELVNLTTGMLTAQQLILLFNHLPVDITYVDADDKVRFYSNPPHRIFPRSKGIIGRDVHLCHPPESVHIVHNIIGAFRQGKQNVASFWITIKDRKILIQYFALHDESGTYQGVIEVSQDITFHRSLEGEQRLLQWTDE